MDSAKFLESLEVGQFVRLYSGSLGKWRVEAVTGLTAGRVKVGLHEFNRKTGIEWGSAASLYRKRIWELTPESIEEAREEVERGKAQIRREAALVRIRARMGGAPIEVLEQVAALLEEKP